MRARLHGFVDALRAEGIVVSVAERIDALSAVAVAGVDRTVLREAVVECVDLDGLVRAVRQALA